MSSPYQTPPMPPPPPPPASPAPHRTPVWVWILIPVLVVALVIAVVLGLHLLTSGPDDESGSGPAPSYSAPASDEPQPTLTAENVPTPGSAPSATTSQRGLVGNPNQPSQQNLQPQNETEQALPGGAQGAWDSGNQANQVDLAATTSYAQAVIVDADKVWSSWMMGLGYPEPYVTYNIIQPGQPLTVEPGCAVPVDQAGNTTTTIDSKFPNAFYCGAQSNGVDRGILILPVESLAKMWSGDILGSPVSDPSKVGDFAAGAVIAHEFGHHVQDELLEDISGSQPPVGKNAELLADCFAGVWTTALYESGNLEEGDVDEAINALRAVGDKSANPKFPHGSPDERDNAFRIGIYGLQEDPRGGVPANCIKVYWPSFGGPR